MTENPSKLKNIVISVVPILALTGFVFYYISKNTSLVDLQKPEKPSLFAGKDLPAPKKTASVQEKESKIYSSGLEIKGDDRFKEQMTQALKLIWLYDRDSFTFVRKYVFEIRQENKTSLYFEEGKPIMAVSEEKAFKSLTWAAGIIAHNAWHSYYELNKKPAKKKEVPLPGEEKFFSDARFKNPLARTSGNFKSFLALEEKACQFQIRILRAVGAPKKEINLILNRPKKDFSINHDGNYFVE